MVAEEGQAVEVVEAVDVEAGANRRPRMAGQVEASDRIGSLNYAKHTLEGSISSLSILCRQLRERRRRGHGESIRGRFIVASDCLRLKRSLPPDELRLGGKPYTGLDVHPEAEHR